jgi:uncharacterized protein (DUF2147 family)
MRHFKQNKARVGTLSRVVAIGLVAFSGVASAQMTPVGTWRSIDDHTKEPKAQVVITEAAGVLTGRIDKILKKDSDPKAVCDKCTDDRKDKPVSGMEIIRGAKKAEGKDVWEGGRVLDPEKGSDYALRLTPIDGGKKLEVRGSIGPFGRTQTWQRVQ